VGSPAQDEPGNIHAFINRWICKQITGCGFEESARSYKDHPGVSIKKYQQAGLLTD